MQNVFSLRHLDRSTNIGLDQPRASQKEVERRAGPHEGRFEYSRRLSRVQGTRGRDPKPPSRYTASVDRGSGFCQHIFWIGYSWTSARLSSVFYDHMCSKPLRIASPPTRHAGAHSARPVRAPQPAILPHLRRGQQGPAGRPAYRDHRALRPKAGCVTACTTTFRPFSPSSVVGFADPLLSLPADLAFLSASRTRRDRR